MYQNGTTLGITTGITTIAVLPNTAGSSLFMHAAIAALIIGGIALLMQLGVAAYRFSLRRSK